LVICTKPWKELQGLYSEARELRQISIPLKSAIDNLDPRNASYHLFVFNVIMHKAIRLKQELPQASIFDPCLQLTFHKMASPRSLFTFFQQFECLRHEFTMTEAAYN
jgi:hypothetical protein